MKTRSRFVIASLLILLVSNGLWAADENSSAKADQAYSEGRFEEAATAYQELVRSGRWNANLFYNLGNAYYRLGKFGQAIVNYERALALEPHHPEADANLRLARDEARALELRKDPIERYAGFLIVKQWAVAAATGFWIALFVAAHLLFARRRTTGRVALVVLGLIVSAVSVFAIVTLENGTSGRDLAIVTGHDVVARIATADSAQTVLALPAGSAIKVLSERGEWLYAALPNDQHGWLPASAIERVRL